MDEITTCAPRPDGCNSYSTSKVQNGMFEFTPRVKKEKVSRCIPLLDRQAGEGERDEMTLRTENTVSGVSV